MPYGLSKFCRFAVNVWEVNPAGKADEQVAREGLSCMEAVSYTHLTLPTILLV